MKVKSKFVGISRDWKTNNLIISFSVPKEQENEFQCFLDEVGSADLEFDFDKWKQKRKRSKDANAYAWTLLSKLAEKHGRTKEEEYEDALKNYGYPDLKDGQMQMVKVHMDCAKFSEKQFREKGLHLLPVEFEIPFVIFALFKGSHNYTTNQMSHFIEGIVSDCKEEGIETLPPEELERLWQKNEKQ